MKKILLFGAGAVGGYFGARLSRHADVTLIARGARLEAMRNSGLRLINKVNPEETESFTIKALEKPDGLYDLIIIAVKSKDTALAAAVCKDHLSGAGAVLSFQNGAGNSAILADVFGADRVLGGVVNSGISVPEPGVIRYEPYPSAKVGALSAAGKQFEESIASLFSAAGVKLKISDDINQDIWAKLVWNIAYNPLSALTGATCGALTENPYSYNIMRNLASEAVAAAAYHGVSLPDDVIEKTLNLNAIYKNYKTSALQDVEANRPPETEGIMGPVVSLSKAGKIKAPAAETIYELCEFRFGSWFHTFPRLAADVLVVNEGKVLLIERKYEPYGWALPGGMVDYGESVEEAARRELEEETGISLDKSELRLLGVYSEPSRDSRGHTVSVVYYAHSNQEAVAADDAKNAAWFSTNALPLLAFDHKKVIEDYCAIKLSN